MLDRALETARELTGANYAALGVLNEQRSELEQFLTVGIDEETRRSIGDLPRGRGVLGVLIDDPRPVRLADVGEHPRSYGFPTGHPPMSNFLGVPITIRGEVWGNLYLTEKIGEFTEADEEAAVILADWAATAIQNARLFHAVERRREELERAVRRLESIHDVVTAIGGATDLDRVLELIVKRGRALVGARSVVIFLRDGSELLAAASAGYAKEVSGQRMPIADSTSGQVLERQRSERIANVSARLRIAPAALGVSDAESALLVPMVYGGEGVGVLAAFDRGVPGGAFSEEDEELLKTFAASAANAVAMAQTVESDRVRDALAAAETERQRWARELHDQTLQGLGGLRVLLAAALRHGDATRGEQAMREAVDQITVEIENLRAIIADLRPASLDELGLRAAIDALVESRRARVDFEIVAELDLPDAAGGGERLDSELEATVYRVVQEALTNVAKHAGATTVRVATTATAGEVVIEIQDDGVGIDAAAHTTGFGLRAMRERVYLADGELTIESPGKGTLVRATLPLRAAGLHRRRARGHELAS